MWREAIQQIFAAGIRPNDHRFANVTPSLKKGGRKAFGNYSSITSPDAAGKLSLFPFICLSSAPSGRTSAAPHTPAAPHLTYDAKPRCRYSNFSQYNTKRAL